MLHRFRDFYGTFPDKLQDKHRCYKGGGKKSIKVDPGAPLIKPGHAGSKSIKADPDASFSIKPDHTLS